MKSKNLHIPIIVEGTVGIDELQTLWYKKLAEEGFNDIESGDDEYLCNPEIISANKCSYKIEKLQDILNRYSQDIKPRDLIILEAYVDGATVPEIAKDIGKTHQAVSYVIRKILEKY